MKTNAKSVRKKARHRNTQSKGLIWTGIIILALAVWVAWNILQPATSASTSTGREGVQVGDLAPDFTVPTLDGGEFRLSEQRGKPTIIFFMAYWCVRCIPEAQALSQLHQEHQGQLNIIVIDVDPSSTPELVEQFKRAANGDALTWAFDPDFGVASSYQVNALDTTLILDTTGVIVYRDNVPSTYRTLKGELEKLIQ
ncbi:MAG: TlpA family protein disulfide reductase [Anaerolineae bacterium]|nr:TlpA family protein disulfide reductase [Anaerolineae bacterium]MCI0610175.1 TlpA family protein disulfide reductase [Anaerolineae bacterium]